MNVEQARFNMIEQQIRPWDVLDTSVLDLLSAVRREDFVPEAHRALAFMDIEIPLPAGQCMLNPKVEARLVQDLDLSKYDNVLQVGAGSGYVTALIAHKAKRVIAIENKPELVALARHNLRKAGINNAEVVEGDGAQGCSAQAPYNAILLTGSVTAVPQILLDQLKPGGRLLAIVGREPVMQATLFIKSDQGQVTQTALFDTLAAPLDGMASPRPFIL
ncbi:MAG TPA: protein-L-isoaspartate O-methyltransferase [Aquabacterium sp.]|nr:protein-L-isoaspartate O-methyltransferase [Aquabacterium sp.]